MPHLSHGKRLARRRAGLALACVIAFAVLPALHASVNAPRAARAAARQDDQTPQIPVIPPGQAYRQTNLVSGIPGVASILDPMLGSPWGVAMTATGPFCVANAETNSVTLYRGDAGGQPFVKNPGLQSISVPGPNINNPTAVVANATDDFVVTSGSASGPARFIFASAPGFIMGWNSNVPAAGSTTAVVASSPPGDPFSFIRVYTGLAIGNNGAGNFLYVADWKGGKIDVFDANFNLTSLAGTFSDPTLPADYHPHNIQALGGELYVAYQKLDPMLNPIRPGGAVSVFDFNGVFKRRIALDGPLSSPWGLALAPASFGVFGGALLVANNDLAIRPFSRFFAGKTHISAFDKTTGAFLGQLQTEEGTPVSIEGLLALTFGNGGDGGDPNTLYFSAGFPLGTLFGSLKPTTASATSIIEFSTDEYIIGEGSGFIDITVTRAGNVTVPASVNYATYDFLAEQRSNYEIALGRLDFHPGETSRTFRVLLVDDGFAIPNRAIGLALSNPAGAGLGSQALAKIKLVNNDADVGPNPINNTEFFVRQHYADFLNRVPDASGLQFWVNQIESCGSDAQCREARRVNVSAAFFLSIEFRETGLRALLTHQAAYGSSPLYGQFMRDTQALQRDFAFGLPGAQEQLEVNKQSFYADFVARPEFVNKYPTPLTPTQYVDALFANAGVAPSTAERNAASGEFGSANDTADQSARARALRRVAENTAFAKAEFNRAFVQMQYFGYLRRDPDSVGFQFWLNKLNSFNGNFVKAEMVKAFISSFEYRRRFGVAIL